MTVSHIFFGFVFEEHQPELICNTLAMEDIMRQEKINIIAGCAGILIAAAGGLCLGFSMDPYFEKGFYALPLGRYLLKAGHTHGMPIALYNLIIGSLLPNLELTDTGKKWCSRLAVCAFIMPIGLVLRGITGGAMTFAPVVLAGALCFLSSIVLVMKGVPGNNPN
ncbi:MAG: hypothetical protein C4518_15850 [Desulfobacteraceae bacterium]|nr:MAG: hypothetical protein C4518_15850 [Desulfobacteraceae bacterium]